MKTGPGRQLSYPPGPPLLLSAGRVAAVFYLLSIWGWGLSGTGFGGSTWHTGLAGTSLTFAGGSATTTYTYPELGPDARYTNGFRKASKPSSISYQPQGISTAFDWDEHTGWLKQTDRSGPHFSTNCA